MNEREIVEQRIVTLSGLLETPGGPLGPAAGSLGRDLAASWDAERRLLERILRETKGGDVMATIAQWQERTAAFVERATDPTPSWSDRDGNTWDAREVVRILSDIQQRIDIWLAAEPPAPEIRPSTAQRPAPSADGVAGTEFGDADDDDDDDDDDAKYVSVLRPDPEQ